MCKLKIRCVSSHPYYVLYVTTLSYTALQCVIMTVNNLQASVKFTARVLQPVASIYRKIYGIFYSVYQDICGQPLRPSSSCKKCKDWGLFRITTICSKFEGKLDFAQGSVLQKIDSDRNMQCCWSNVSFNNFSVPHYCTNNFFPGKIRKQQHFLV